MTVRILPLPEPEIVEPPDGGLGALSTEKGNLPLDSVDVRASIAGLAGSIEVAQGFRNPFDVPLEATYIFPLPDRAAVTRLRLEAADRVIEGVLKERGQARQDYDTAIAAGRRAAIAEEERPDVFTMRVGNILPGERVTVRLTLNQPLPYETGDGAATFRFPLVVAPRYIPGAPLEDVASGSGVVEDTNDVPDASRITPPVLLPGFPSPVQLSISVDVDPAGLPLTEIRSALHVTATEESEGRTTVRLQPGNRLDRDFILRLGYAPQDDADDAPAAALALVPDESGTEGTFTLTVLPSGESRPRPRDVVLVLDRSGSMHGWKMIAARRAAARVVDTFTAADRFAVLSFDNTIERPRDLGAGLAAGTDRNRFRAVEHLAAIDARGGTEMLSPLDQACTLLADSTNDRVLVLITDGQIGNEDQILARLAPRLQGVRVHTVGIDRAVNAGFLRRLADIGQGRCELVESEDRLDEAMEHIHHRIGAPLATGLSLHPEGLDVVSETVAPTRLGALFPGVPLVISGRFRGTAAGGITVRGTAADGTTPWQRQAAATLAKAPAAAAIWARAHLRDLEDRWVVAGSDELEKRIVDTSLRFGVLCRFTAFVAVDSRVATEGEAPHQVIQPVETPQGWAASPAVPMSVSAPMPAAPGAFSGGAPPVPPAPAQARGSFRQAAESYGAAPADMPDFLAHEDLATAAPPPERALRRSKKRPVPSPGGQPGSVPAEGRLLTPQQQLTRELDRLTTLQSVPPARRHEHLLTHLLPILESAVQDLNRSGTTPPPLAALLADLQAAAATPSTDPTHLDELWSRTVQVLTDFTAPPPPTPNRPFWKRRP